MSGSDGQLLADMEAFWVTYDETETEGAKLVLYRDFLLEHGGRYPDGRDSAYAQTEGTVIGGIHPVRVADLGE